MVYFKLPNDANNYWVALSTADGPTPVWPFALRAGDVLTNITGVVRQVSTPAQANHMGLSADSATGSNYPIVKNQCGSGARAGDSHGVLLGGSFGFFTLLPLFGAGLFRRRKK